MSSFKMQIHSRDRNRDCEVSTLSRFLLKVNPSLDPKELLGNDEHQYYQAVKESIELCRKRAEEAYDYVVIDEGQDMFDKGVDLIINEFAGSSHDGLNNGWCLLLYDIDQSYGTDGRNVLEISYLLSGYFAHYELNDVKRSSQNPDICSLSRDIIDDVGILRKDHYDAEKYQPVGVNYVKTLSEIKTFIVNKLLIPHQKSTFLIEGSWLHPAYWIGFIDTIRHLVKDDEFLRSVTKQMQGNSKDDKDLLSKEVQPLRKNEAQITKRLGNPVEQLSADAKLKKSETITNAVIELEKQRFELRDLIRQKEKALERVKIGKVDVAVLKQMLSEHVELYHSYTSEQKRRINHLIFGGIVSNFERNEVTGDLEILTRGDGTIRKMWEEFKKENQAPTVRTPGSLGSALNTRTL